MGQTLTHGVYLPDEGERNCYSGLAANWQLLDGAVGTIAEHSTQISGKAPLVHTHTKADITDFPVYGNAAGTICEGNDSRLSDARTPVAHTHTKSDVTDLFNSANTWSAENSFNHANLNRKYNFTLGDNSYQISRIQYQDKDSTRWGVLSFIHNTDNSVYCDIGVNCLKNDGQTVLNKSIRFLIQPDNNSEFKPINDKAIDLGSSINQWKSIYAQSYYYNGVAWGLDKANTWTQNQTISINLPVFTLQDTIGVRDTTPANARNLIFSFLDKNGDSYGFINRQHKPVTGTHLHQVSINNGTYDYRLQFYLFTNGASNFAPSNDGIIELGTSTNRWKTLNGCNPGALSLPNSPGGTGTVNVNYYDLSGNITVRDGSAANSFTALCDGWIAIGTFATWLQISNDTLILATTANPGTDGFAQAFLPVRKGNAIRIVVNQTNTQFQSFKLLPCEGNV